MALGPVNGITYFMLNTTSGLGAPVSIIRDGQSQVCVVTAGNTNSAPRFLKFFDAAAANISSNAANMTAAWQMIIPGNASGAGTNLAPSPGPPMLSGIQHLAGLAVAITANGTITDSSGVSGANDCFAMIGWR